MLTLDKFEEASEKVKEVTLETKLVYSDFLSAQTGNKVYLKPENMQFTGAYKVRGAYYKMSTLTEEERAKFLAYPGVNGNTRAAADEYIAHYAENFEFMLTQPLDTLQVVGYRLFLVEELAPQQSLAIGINN